MQQCSRNSARGQAFTHDLARLEIDQICPPLLSSRTKALAQCACSRPKAGPTRTDCSTPTATARRENDRASTVGHQNTQGPLPIYPPLLGGSTTAIVRRCAHGLPRALQGLPPSHARRPLRAVSTATPPRGATGSDIVHKTSI